MALILFTHSLTRHGRKWVFYQLPRLSLAASSTLLRLETRSSAPNNVLEERSAEIRGAPFLAFCPPPRRRPRGIHSTAAARLHYAGGAAVSSSKAILDGTCVLSRREKGVEKTRTTFASSGEFAELHSLLQKIMILYLIVQPLCSRATNAKMGPIEHGRRKAERDTRATCRLFEQEREDKVEQVPVASREATSATSLPNAGQRAEAASSCCHFDLVYIPGTSRDPVKIILFSRPHTVSQ
jgi:hypothetical protein